MMGFCIRIASALARFLGRCAGICHIGRLWPDRRTNSLQVAPRPAIAFRALEPRRVLSVNAAFAAGVLDVVIADDGGSTDATLMSDDETHFFVDADGDQTYDDGSSGASELRGLLSELTRINVVGDAGLGSFFWRDNFSSAALSNPSGDVVHVAHVATVDLAATAAIEGHVSLAASQSIHLGGALAIDGDLSAQVVTSGGAPTGVISSAPDGSLDVTGHAALQATEIDIGNQASDHLALGALTITSNGSVEIHEDGSSTDPDTLLVGSNSAASLRIVSDGSIMLADGATITGVDLIDLDADGTGIYMHDGSQLTVEQGAVHLTATGTTAAQIELSHITAGPSARIEIVASGSILDATADEAANIDAPTGSLLLRSLTGGIGSVADDLGIDVQNLAFDAGAAEFGIVNVSDLAGGLRIDAASRAGAGANITAHSPLTIAADISLGASSTFTAGNSSLAGDNLTIENGAAVVLNAAAAGALVFNAGDDIAFRDGGRIVTLGSNAHQVTLNADLDHAGLGAIDGDRGSITQNTVASIEVTTHQLTAIAAENIDLDTVVDRIDVRSTLAGDIVIRDGSSLQVDHAETVDGAINIRAALDVLALNVKAAGNTGDVTLLAIAGDIGIGSVTANSNVVVTASLGAIHDQNDDSLVDLSAATGTIRLTAAHEIAGLGADNRIELADGSQLIATNRSGDIRLSGLGSLTLTNIVTGDGAIDIVAKGTVDAVWVDSSATDSDVNDISMVTTLGDVRVSHVRAGVLNGDVSIDAQGSVLDGDTGVDDVDIEGNDVLLIARSGDIGTPTGQFFIDRPNGLDVITHASPLTPLEMGDLTANAVNGAVVLQATVAGSLQSTAVTLYVLSDGDLDTSTSIFNVTNLALIADTDGDGLGTLTLADSLLVSGDLWLEGADVVSAGPSAPLISLSASRLLFRSGGQAELSVATQALDATTENDLRISSTLADIELVDLNEDLFALQTIAPTASLALYSAGSFTVSDLVQSGQHSTLVAANDARLEATITAVNGDIFIRAENATIEGIPGQIDGILVNDSLSVTSGSVLLQSLGDIHQQAGISSAAGSVGLLSSGDILQTANVAAGNDVFIDAGGNFTQSSGSSTTAGGTLQVISGGSQRLGLLSAGHIALDATGDVLDNNGANTLNLRADTVRIVAGGIIGGSDLANSPDANGNAIDMNVGTIAARSVQGIYLQELANGGALVVGHVQGSASVTVSVLVNQVRFNSTTSTVSAGDVAGTNLKPLDDLETTGGPIKVVVRGGDLIVNDGNDGDGIGVTAGGMHDVLLWASGNLNVNAQVLSGGGHISLQAGNDIAVAATVRTVGVGSLYLAGRDIGISATLETAAGDQLLSASRDVTIAAAMTSITGSIGVVAGRDVSQSANIAVGEAVLMNAGRDFTQTGVTSITASKDVFMEIGRAHV